MAGRGRAIVSPRACHHRAGARPARSEGLMRKIPPLNSIRAFEAVARHQSFTAAAEELCVTVAAVSHQVRQLEEGLGQKLLERGRQVRLTAAGQTLYPLLRDGFDQIAHAFALISPPARGDAIQLSTTRAFAERWLMPRLARFNAIHPDILVPVHEIGT